MLISRNTSRTKRQSLAAHSEVPETPWIGARIAGAVLFGDAMSAMSILGVLPILCGVAALKVSS